MTKNRTSFFHKTENTEFHTEFNSPQQACGSYCKVKPADSRIRVKHGKIVSGDQNAVTLFGVKNGATLASLFKDNRAYRVKLSELDCNQTCRAYLRRIGGKPFWARITVDKDCLVITDNHIEENFLIDGEELIESMERESAEVSTETKALTPLNPGALFLENTALFP